MYYIKCKVFIDKFHKKNKKIIYATKNDFKIK